MTNEKIYIFYLYHYLADSVSIAGGDMERFWPRLSFPTDLDMNKDMSMYRPCDNMSSTSLSTTSHTLSSKLEQMSTQNNKPPSSLLLRDLPILSDDSIFKVPTQPQQKSSKINRIPAFPPRKYMSGKESSDTEGESIKIPPMDIIDTTPITSSCNLPVENPNTQVHSITVALPVKQTLDNKQNETISQQRTMYDQSHYLQNHQITQIGNGHHHALHLGNGGSGGSTNSVHSSPSRSTMTPPSTPSPVTPLKLPDVTKSPSKSKSRKISKFFRTRSKSPKTAGATSSSESGKSSMSSDAKHSSSSSSCSSGVSAPLAITPSKQKSHSSPKHMSPSRHTSPSKKQSSRKNSCFSTSTASSTDYHFTCDSVLPMFLPNPNPNKKIGGSVDATGNGVITYN